METIRDLIDVMNKQLSVYEELLGIEKNKSEVIANGDIERLDVIINQEQSINMQAANLERTRTALVESLGYKELSVSQIIGRLSESDADALDRVFGALLETLGALKDQNDLNMRILESRLGVIEYILNEAQLDTGEVGLYTSEAKRQKQDTSSTNLQKKI